VTLKGRDGIADTPVTGAAVATALGGDKGQGGALLRAGASSAGPNAHTNPDSQTISFTSSGMQASSDAQQITTLHEGLPFVQKIVIVGGGGGRTPERREFCAPSGELLHGVTDSIS